MSKNVSKFGVQDVVIMDSCLATMSKTLSQCKGVEIVTRCKRTAHLQGRLVYNFVLELLLCSKWKKVSWATFASKAHTYGYNSHKVKLESETPRCELVKLGMEEGNAKSDHEK